MVNSYGQKPMEKPWIITHGDFMEFFCKGTATRLEIHVCIRVYQLLETFYACIRIILHSLKDIITKASNRNDDLVPWGACNG